MIIYAHDGTEKITGISISKECKRKFELMKDDYIKLKFTLTEYKKIEIGDYTDHDYFGRFVVTEDYMPTLNTKTGGYDYDITFEAQYRLLKNHIIKYSNNGNAAEASWALTAFPSVFLQIIIQNITNLDTAETSTTKHFKYWNHKTSSYQSYVSSVQSKFNDKAVTLSFQSTSILDAITSLAQAMNDGEGVDWFFDGHYLCLGNADKWDYTHRVWEGDTIYVAPTPINICQNNHENKVWRDSNDDDPELVYTKVSNPTAGTDLCYTNEACTEGRAAIYATTSNSITRATDLKIFTRRQVTLNTESISVSDSKTDLGTRLIPFGSTTNISKRYRKDLKYKVASVNTVTSGGSTYYDITAEKGTDYPLDVKYFSANMRDMKEGTEIASIKQTTQSGSSTGSGAEITFEKELSNSAPASDYKISFQFVDWSGVGLAKFLNGYVIKIYPTTSGAKADSCSVTISVLEGSTVRASAIVNALQFDDGAIYVSSVDLPTLSATTEATSVLKVQFKIAINTSSSTTWNAILSYVAGQESATDIGSLNVIRTSPEYAITSIEGSVTDKDSPYTTHTFTGAILNPSYANIKSDSARVLRIPSSIGYVPEVGDTFTIDNILRGLVPFEYFASQYDSENIKYGVVATNLMLPNVACYVKDGIYYREGSQPSGSTKVYDGDGYIDTEANLPISKVKEKVIMFDSVYPSYKSYVKSATFEAVADKDDDGDFVGTYTYYWAIVDGQTDVLLTTDMGLDRQDMQVVFGSVTINGTTHSGGSLNGMTFELKLLNEETINGVKHTKFKIVPSDEYGVSLPNDTMKPIGESSDYNGDGYNITNIDAATFSSQLEPQAEMELLKVVLEYIDDLKEDSKTYTAKMMSDWMYEQMNYGSTWQEVFRIGTNVKLVGGQFAIGQASRVIGCEFQLDLPYDTPTVIIGKSSVYSRLGAMEDKIDGQKYKGASVVGGSIITGGSGSSIYLIQSGDTTPASETNTFSAKRILSEIASQGGIKGVAVDSRSVLDSTGIANIKTAGEVRTSALGSYSSAIYSYAGQLIAKKASSSNDGVMTSSDKSKLDTLPDDVIAYTDGRGTYQVKIIDGDNTTFVGSTNSPITRASTAASADKVGHTLTIKKTTDGTTTVVGTFDGSADTTVTFESGGGGGGETNIIEDVKVNGSSLTVTNKSVNIPLAVAGTTDGAMSKEDKTKLDGIASGATNTDIQAVEESGTTLGYKVVVENDGTAGSAGAPIYMSRYATRFGNSSDYYTKSTLDTALAGKQDTLTAGDYISINTSTDEISVQIGDGLKNDQDHIAVDTDTIATKTYVNSVGFKGIYNSINGLPSTHVALNDYAYVMVTDSDGNVHYNRYKYTTDSSSSWVSTDTWQDGGIWYTSGVQPWQFEYQLESVAFSAAQWNAINSGVTSAWKSSVDSTITALPDTYLGKTAKAADADKLDGHDSSYYATAASVTILGEDVATIEANYASIDYVDNADETLQENIDAVSAQVNALTLDDVADGSIRKLTNYSKVADIKDNLTSTDTNKPLSANQGKILNSHLSNVDTSLSEINTALAGKLPLTGGTLTGLLNITTNGKTTTFGSKNASFCHFVTTAPQFYFNKPTIFEGHLRPYVDNDSMLGNKDHRWKNIFAHKITTDQEELPKKILYIGSSHGRDTIGLLPKLAYESGITDIEVQVYYRGSLTLAQIAEYCNDSAYINYGWRKVFKNNAWTAKTYTENTWKMAAMLTENEWDYIFIQRAASEDEVWDSTTSANLTTILNYIKACCPWTPKVVFSSGYADVWQTGWTDISNMQRSTQRIIDSAMNAKDFGIDVLPIAPYIQTLRNDSTLADKGTCNLSISHPYLGRWSSAGTDNQHLDEGIGLFCTACLMYQYLYSRFGKSVYDFDYIPIMSDVESYMGGDWVANGFDSAALSEPNTIALIKRIAVNFDLNGDITRNSANLYDYTKHGVQKGVINSLGAIVSNGYRTGLIPVKPNRYYYLSNRLNHSASNFTISTLRVILEDGTYTKVLIASTGVADPNYYYLATAAGTYSLVGQFKTPANAAYIEISLTGSASGTELGTDFNITLEDSSATAFAWKSESDAILYTKKINPVAGTDKAYSDTAFTTELTITTSTSGATIVVGGTTYTRYTSGDTAVYDASFTPMANKVSKEYIPDTSLEIPVVSRIPEPRVEGTVGQVLTINSSGERVWTTPQSGTTYTAGDGISIESGEISIDDDYIDFAFKDDDLSTFADWSTNRKGEFASALQNIGNKVMVCKYGGTAVVVQVYSVSTLIVFGFLDKWIYRKASLTVSGLSITWETYDVSALSRLNDFVDVTDLFDSSATTSTTVSCATSAYQLCMHNFYATINGYITKIHAQYAANSNGFFLYYDECDGLTYSSITRVFVQCSVGNGYIQFVQKSTLSK